MKALQKRMTSITLVLSLVFTLSVPALATESTDLKSSALTAATYAYQYGSAQSLQYAIWEDGAVTLTGHVGTYSRTENKALTDDNLYGIGSVSKMYLTAAVMKLAEEGKLMLDVPVIRYLPSFKMKDARYKQITVRMLLNHSSGLMGSSMDSAMLFNDTDRSATEDLLQRLSNQRLKADPGSYSVYCNDGFTLAELVVEVVSGMSFPEYLQKELLSPMDLQNTFVPSDDFDTTRLAKIYSGTDTHALPQECLGTVGTGGIYATASDLASFGGTLTTTKLLDQSSLNTMAYPEYKKGIWPADDLDSLSFGLGWDSVKTYPFCQSDIQALVKGGDTSYYHASLVVIPEYHLAAAVVSSGGLSTYDEMAACSMLISALAEKDVSVDDSVPTLQDAKAVAIPDIQLQNAGYYASTTQQMNVDISSDGILTIHSMTYPSSPAQTFTYYSDGSFRDSDGKVMVKFVKEGNGNTYLYQKAFITISGLGVLPTSNYAAEKLEDNAVSQDVQVAWDAARTMNVLPMNEKYTSELYLALSSANTGEISEQIPGYFSADRIVDANTALYELQIPGNAGRDGQDLTLSQKNGVTWYTSRSSIYMSIEGASDLYAGEQSYTTVQPDGYARWYKIDSAAGKTMTVTLPEDGGFYVYNAKGQITASSILWGDTKAELPKGGLVVFAGNVGARFHLELTA